MRSSLVALACLALGLACSDGSQRRTLTGGRGGFGGTGGTGGIGPGGLGAGGGWDWPAAPADAARDTRSPADGAWDAATSPDTADSPDTATSVDTASVRDTASRDTPTGRDTAPDAPAPVAGPPAVRPLPTRDQAAYQRLERIAFFHFGPNTYVDSEFGDGNADPSVFNPTELDARQWMAVLKSAGFKLGMLTAKHHDGFCLWPTKCGEYNVAKSPWKNGQGDVIKEFTDAARAAGIKVGLYLSPLSNHAADSSGAPGYFDKLKCMLTEVLSNYGEVSEVWFDGNLAPRGDWNEVVALVRRLQPRVVIQMGPEIAVMNADIRWVGNEAGIAPPGTASVQTRNGTPVWYPAECDVSIRPGWFHHDSQDSQVKSVNQLLDIYFKSVGRNCPLLLNIPPDQRGLIAAPDVARMMEFGNALASIFRTNQARGQAATADSVFADAPDFAAARAVDDNLGSYWAAAGGKTAGRLEIDLGASKSFTVVSIQEPIQLGERSTKYHVEIQAEGADTWTTIGSGTVIGTRNLLRLGSPQAARKLALVIEQARAVPAIAELAVY